VIKTEYDVKEINQWPFHQINGEKLQVSSPILCAKGGELNHYRLTPVFSGDGVVELAIAHWVKNDLNHVLETNYLQCPFAKATSGKKVAITSPYRGENCSWILLKTQGNVNLSSIHFSCWAGKETMYGHIAQTFNFQGADLPYRIMYPRNYKPSKKYPLVVSISGSKGVGNSNTGQMGMTILGRFLFEHYYFDKEFECFSIVPQIIPDEYIRSPYYPKGSQGSPTPAHPDWPLVNEQGWYTQATIALIDDLIKCPDVHIDPQRIYITGYSYGGKAVWEFLKADPDRFAGAIGVGGWAIGRVGAESTLELVAILRQEVDTYKHVPAYIVAGQKDGRMAKGSRLLYQVMTERGAKGRYVELPNTDHTGSAIKTWANKDIIGWLFKQKKDEESKP
jgi:poly(3-hydroxybutyrate) depolymerase